MSKLADNQTQNTAELRAELFPILRFVSSGTEDHCPKEADSTPRGPLFCVAAAPSIDRNGPEQARHGTVDRCEVWDVPTAGGYRQGGRAVLQ